MSRPSYNLSNLKKAVNNPSLIGRELLRLVERPILPYQNWKFKQEFGSGITVYNQEWDNLFILDACRADYFQKVNFISGDLKIVTSQGSSSWGFLEGNFHGEELHDTIYISANPHATKLPDGTFYAVETVLDDWDDQIGTVPPEKVTEKTLIMNKKHPDKKIISHFMQPHQPWIGKVAESIRKEVNIKGWNKNTAQNMGEVDTRTGMGGFTAVKLGIISKEKMLAAYSESIEIVLQEIEQLIKSLDGKSVITSDHGELLGERVTSIGPKRYGHPSHISSYKLCMVPWLEPDYKSRRTVIPGSPIKTQTSNQDVVNDRLQALGYAPEDD